MQLYLKKTKLDLEKEFIKNIEKIYVNSELESYEFINAISKFKNNFIRINKVKKVSIQDDSILNFKIESIESFQENIEQLICNISSKNNINYRQQILLKEEEILFKSKDKIEILKLKDFKKISINKKFFKNDNLKYRISEHITDVCFVYISIFDQKNNEISFSMMFPKYLSYKNSYYEIEFSFSEVEKNIINLILNHYEEYKDKISMISKL